MSESREGLLLCERRKCQLFHNVEDLRKMHDDMIVEIRKRVETGAPLSYTKKQDNVVKRLSQAVAILVPIFE